MPGIKEIGIKSPQVSTAKDILLDFAKTFWHYDQITGMSEKKFISRYLVWAKKKGHRPDVGKAAAIYAMAKDGIPCLPADPIVKQSIHTNIEALERVGTTLRDILSQMSGLAKTLPEYDIVRAMGGVGDVLVVKLIAVIGDIKRFRKAKSLVAYAGIDPPPYSSGKFEGNKRRISKRGSTLLRKIGYEIMKSLTRNKRPEDGAVYDFIRKKEEEGKLKSRLK
ncbi:MAG: transposase [Dialister invisus]|uniref:transposase n=1 Tax=Dialister invisus TaxID=218538 RepID=UPI0039A2836F